MSENTEKKSTAGSVIATVVLAAVCAAGGWIVHGLMPKGAGPQGPDMAAMMAGAAQTVAVRPVESRIYNRPEQYVAHAEAVQEVDLLPQVDGYIKAIMFKEGDLVK